MPVFSAVAGGVASAGIGALLGGGSGGGTTQRTQGVPNFSASDGLFSSTFRKSGKETRNGVATFKNNDIRSRISNPQLQEINRQGLFGANDFLTRARQGDNAQFFEDQGRGFLDALGSSNPMDVAQSQFNLLNPILQDQQNQDFLGQEQRLFAQGRLGGAGELSGQAQQNALFDAQNDAERQLLFDSFGQGLQAQQQQYNIGAGLTNLGGAQRSNDFNLGQGFLQIPLELQNAMQRQQQIASGVSGGNITQTQGGAGFNPVQTVGAGLLNSGVQGLTNTANDFFSQGGGFSNLFGGGNTGSGVSPTPGNNIRTPF